MHTFSTFQITVYLTFFVSVLCIHWLEYAFLASSGSQIIKTRLVVLHRVIIVFLGFDIMAMKYGDWVE